MTAKVLMVQGTASSVGKSLLVTALCRIFSQDGLRVAPFKAQNLSLNSFVTAEGHEMGRSQVVQAEASGIAPHVDMNPVLIKPEGDARSQVVVMGRPWQALPEMSYGERKLSRPDAVILPGTKHTLADLRWLYSRGLDRRILDLARQGVAVVGICGGYQMLGRTIADPLGVESAGGERLDGLGLLPLATEFATAKTTHQARAETLSGPGFLALAAGTPVTGYEIHMGHSTRAEDEGGPLFRLSHREALDGTIDAAGRVWGTYLHGIFDNMAFRRAWLRSLGWSPPDEDVDLSVIRQATYDRLAVAVRASLDMSRLRQIIELGR